MTHDTHDTSSEKFLKKVCHFFENRNAIVVSLQCQNEVGNALPN